MSLMKGPLDTLGILQNERVGSPPFAETAFCRKLCLSGQKRGVPVLIFSPHWIDWGKRLVRGYTYEDQEWKSVTAPIPKLVYDRLTFTNEVQYRKNRAAVARMRLSGTAWLSVGLGGKWDMYRSLSRIDSIKHLLPETSLYSGVKALNDFLHEHQGKAFLKPHSGSKGRSALFIQHLGSSAHADSSSIRGYTIVVKGRDDSNQPFEHNFDRLQTGLHWIHSFINGRKYVLQPYLTLNSPKEEPFDLRTLMQKDETGRWALTGMAVRIGLENGITSNLHGGGHAADAAQYLRAQYGASVSQQLIHDIIQYSECIPEALEARHGRLAELGIDFGIDRSSRIWLLEVNSKPGRAVFEHTGEREAEMHAVERPILYARHVLVRHLRRVCP
ncbi:YheC/YheD family protein [Paenibacillus sp. UMB4589-SE434]|uniref:YheC/YheD family endospore coat-associated protein n=1 Tax=Paenibacillus sp. UMB4589-SE434 TaxID=3046314 RepID=UPI00254D2420|nr:YheC/YheD family protein [Paenibacillus sp. UMB4589-SE434]MDK8182287.1 YheC/YheD family protein [Paenibacillus sp. UMB4589-SE434]